MFMDYNKYYKSQLLFYSEQLLNKWHMLMPLHCVEDKPHRDKRVAVDLRSCSVFIHAFSLKLTLDVKWDS